MRLGCGDWTALFSDGLLVSKNKKPPTVIDVPGPGMIVLGGAMVLISIRFRCVGTFMGVSG